MATLEQTRRCSFRLPTATVNLVDGRRTNTTRSRAILDCLKMLVHDLQTDRISSEFKKLLLEDNRYMTSRTVVYIRVPVILLEYLKFNGYNLTHCIEAAISVYFTQAQTNKKE